jgi:hypothetical protein
MVTTKKSIPVMMTLKRFLKLSLFLPIINPTSDPTPGSNKIINKLIL